MPALLAAEKRIALDHLFQNVLVPHRRPDHTDPVVRQCPLQAQVRHHRRDHFLQTAGGLQPAAAQQQDAVAIHDLAGVRNEHGAIGVAVEGNPQRRSRFEHALAQSFYVERAAVEIDVLAVRSAMDAIDLGAQPLKERGCQVDGRSIGSVDHDGHTGQPIGHGGGEMFDVSSIEPFIHG
jgi:hypothetical protein